MLKINQKSKGILFIIIAAFGFSGMSLFVKLSGELPAFQKAFFRNFVALLFISFVILKNKEGFIPDKKNIPDILLRSVFGTVGLVCNFYAIGYLNLSDANMLNKLSPFFSILFSFLILKEKPNFVQLLGVAAAFLGSVLIIKPGFDNPAVIPAIAGLIGGMGAGIAYTFVRRLGFKKENGNRIIFWFSLFSCAVCFPLMIISFKPMSVLQTVNLIFAGIFACIGQLGITRAYMYAPAKEISVYDYTQVIFAAVLGYFVFGDLPDILSISGYLMIIGAGIAMFFYNKRKDQA